MISRRTAIALGEVYEEEYTYYSAGYPKGRFKVNKDRLYDFLFENSYPAYLCNSVRNLYSTRRAVKEWIMKLHTGETISKATPNWTWEQREKLGQRFLQNLAEDLLIAWNNKRVGYDYYGNPETSFEDKIKELLRSLELDGYVYRDCQLLAPESDVLDVREEAGVLETTFTSLTLENKETAFHHLQLSEEHYIAQRWDDSISNSRKFLECILQEVAAAHSLRCKNTPLSEDISTRPARVREYLEKENLLESKEKEALAKVYGLLSETGSHPYMARNDQARLLRHLALTFSQFVMLRLQGVLGSS